CTLLKTHYNIIAVVCFILRFLGVVKIPLIPPLEERMFYLRNSYLLNYTRCLRKNLTAIYGRDCSTFSNFLMFLFPSWFLITYHTMFLFFFILSSSTVML